ncbi:MAG: hypothetical protein GEU93_01490 [Propionibacteriales bacterium]|nr:hypothetical protein [Propionibacteriales bacterium]
MKTAWKVGLAAVVFAAGIGWVVGRVGGEPADLPEVGNPVQVSEIVNSGRADDGSEAPRRKNGPSGESSDDDGDDRSGRGGGTRSRS